MDTRRILFAVLVVALVFVAGVGLDLLMDVPVAYAASGDGTSVELAAVPSEVRSLSNEDPMIQIVVGLLLLFFIAIAVLPVIAHGDTRLDR